MTAIDLSGKSTGELVTMFNAKADILGIPPVKKFADRKTAEARVSKIIERVGSVAGATKTNGNGANAPAVTPALVAKTKEQIAKVKRRTEGEMVGKGSYRDKLLSFMQLASNTGKFISISRLMEAVYGQSRKDFKGPLMMVMKGLKVVLDENKTGLEIRKSRENKENHFGLFKKN